MIFKNLSDKRRRQIIAILLTTGLIFIALSISFAYSSPDQNVAEKNSNGLSVTVTPENVTTPGLIADYVTLRITVQDDRNFSVIRILNVNNEVLYEENFTPRPYTLAYILLTENTSPVILNVSVSGGQHVDLAIQLNTGYSGVIYEIILISGVLILVFSISLIRTNYKNYLFLIPAYLGISVLFGQRYDDFFMITSGMDLLEHINPYIISRSLAPGLQWEYPPLYVFYSALSAVFYRYILGMPLISYNESSFNLLNFGNIYSSWRLLEGSNLFVLYLLDKLPFVISFFWIARNLEKTTKITPWKSWLLNPLAVVVGIAWGQLDVLGLAFLVQGIVYYRKGEDFKASLFASIGAGIKIFPVFVIPYLLFKSRNKVKTLIPVLLVLVAVILGYAVSGNALLDLQTIIIGRSTPNFANIFSAQGLTWQIIPVDLGISSFPSLFLYAFIPLYIIFTAYSIKKGLKIEEYFVIVMLIFFVTYNYVNPQYLIWLLPFLIEMGDRRKLFIYSLLGSLYIALDYSFTYFLNPDISWNYIASSLGEIDVFRQKITGNFVVLVIYGTMSSALFFYEIIHFLKRRKVEFVTVLE